MADTNRQELGRLARLVVALAIVLSVTGLVWHGVSVEVLERLGHNLIARSNAPMRFRFILQPTMATIAAIRDGLADARNGRSPYFVTMMGNPEERAPLLREALNATARIILLGIGMDVVYQATVLRTFYPKEALIIALLLAFVPYLVLRGVVLRVARARTSAPRPR